MCRMIKTYPENFSQKKKKILKKDRRKTKMTFIPYSILNLKL